MLKITEIKGCSHVFTLADGSTFRIFARETNEVKESLITAEFKRAEDMGLIVMSKAPSEEVPVPTNTKKNGGTK